MHYYMLVNMKKTFISDKRKVVYSNNEIWNISDGNLSENLTKN